ncbi:hypothetical protein DU504_05620 [Haloplanus salinus]|jgi:hypothetical protein|uniref:Uncharacterized protein n=1 Tax=Haloplanus salinus TaxID=1126245 RepID=A0A368N8E3_9EURY|nr:hypothetical protein [Haloplanus salinus]RCU46827.1 hypothetical protein DU504_05620 [Haloplanus salinus]
MSNRSREADTTDHRSDSAGRTDGKLLAPDTRTALRALADRIDERAGALPIGPARHHARRAAVAARGVADEDAQLGARRVAVGELVTELRTAADEAAATRSQYDLLQLLYEDALPLTREASADIYG